VVPVDEEDRVAHRLEHALGALAVDGDVVLSRVPLEADAVDRVPLLPLVLRIGPGDDRVLAQRAVRQAIDGM
jgi:hypothetical protein